MKKDSLTSFNRTTKFDGVHTPLEPGYMKENALYKQTPPPSNTPCKNSGDPGSQLFLKINVDRQTVPAHSIGRKETKDMSRSFLERWFPGTPPPGYVIQRNAVTGLYRYLPSYNTNLTPLFEHSFRWTCLQRAWADYDLLCELRAQDEINNSWYEVHFNRRGR